MEGLLLIDKPAGMTSFDVVRQVRRLARTKKVGHTGTLDPDATGLLCVALGKCTKLARYLQMDSKAYEFFIEFGAETTTDDATGEPTHSASSDHVTEEALRGVLCDFTGELQQVPPIFSAIHVNGKRAYELARAGEEFELPARPVRIDALEVLEVDLPRRVKMRVDCGSGTYVRSLARDIARALETRAHASGIHRVVAGPFALGEAAKLEDLTQDNIADSMLTPRQMLASLPEVLLDDDGLRELSFGRPVPAPDELQEGVEVGLVAPDGTLAAVGVIATSDERRIARPKRVLLKS